MSKKKPNMEERFGIRIELPEPFLHQHLEAYQEPLARLTAGNTSDAVHKGAILKAGILAGFVTGLAVEQVGELESYKVRWASVELYGLVGVAEKVPEGAPYGMEIELPQPFLQKHLEKYQEKVREMVLGTRSQAALDRSMVAAAIQVEWLAEVKVEEIPGMRAGVVRWAANAVRGRVALANEVPPE